jgi:hypothetical protein
MYRNGDKIWDKWISDNLAMGEKILGKRDRGVRRQEKMQETQGSKTQTTEDQGRRTIGTNSIP